MIVFSVCDVFLKFLGDFVLKCLDRTSLYFMFFIPPCVRLCKWNFFFLFRKKNLNIQISFGTTPHAVQFN